MPTAAKAQEATLEALRQNGGQGTAQEIVPLAHKILGCTEQQMNYQYPKRPGVYVLWTRLHIARQQLKARGVIKLKGLVWHLTEQSMKIPQVAKARDESNNVEKLLVHLQNNLDKQGLQLERIIKRLLELQGFKNIETTPTTNDGGIDLKAVKDHGWGGEGKLIIQVKNYAAKNKINNDIVASLRGRAAANHLCWIITTSDFTPAAQKEAESADGKAEMRLTNGLELAQMLIESDIELKHIYPT